MKLDPKAAKRIALEAIEQAKLSSRVATFSRLYPAVYRPLGQRAPTITLKVKRATVRTIEELQLGACPCSFCEYLRRGDR